MTLALAAWTLVLDAHSCGCSHPQESSQVCTGALCSQMVAMLSPGGNPFPLLVITAGGSPPAPGPVMGLWACSFTDGF